MNSLPLSIEHNHRAELHRYGKVLKRQRKRLLIPPYWSINLEVACPEQLPDAQGYCTWKYLPNAQFRIALACDLDNALAEWVIAHELLEAMTSRYAVLYENALGTLERQTAMSPLALEMLREMHGDIRNEIIEWMLRIILKRERPETWKKFPELLLA